MTELPQQRSARLPKPQYHNLFREPVIEPAGEADQVDEWLHGDPAER
ncbi:hypothetical protein ACFVYE_32305 [Streptomyces sp. NPDC058239]